GGDHPLRAPALLPGRSRERAAPRAQERQPPRHLAARGRSVHERARVIWPPALEVVDSHTEGEPTRVVTGGGPPPSGATMAERRDALRREQDLLRRAVVCEPRGHDAVVGALLTPPVSEGALAGVVFFNNAGVLGMCGHGAIGVVRTLEHLGRLRPGRARL